MFWFIDKLSIRFSAWFDRKMDRAVARKLCRRKVARALREYWSAPDGTVGNKCIVTLGVGAFPNRATFYYAVDYMKNKLKYPVAYEGHDVREFYVGG